jgi:hypothetical protein
LIFFTTIYRLKLKVFENQNETIVKQEKQPPSNEKKKTKKIQPIVMKFIWRKVEACRGHFMA